MVDPFPPSPWLTGHDPYSLNSNPGSTELPITTCLHLNYPRQPLLSLIYPLRLLAVTPHDCSQDNTHDRWPSFGHCWILRIQCARPTLPWKRGQSMTSSRTGFRALAIFLMFYWQTLSAKVMLFFTYLHPELFMLLLFTCIFINVLCQYVLPYIMW